MATVSAGCELPSEWTASGEPRVIALDEPFVLDEGTSVRIGDADAVLVFEDVPLDSRCPTGAECVWAGEAESHFELRASRDTTLVLSIPGLVETPFEQNEKVEALNFTIQLLQLKPYPDSIAKPSERSPYRALLRVDTR